MSELDNTQTNEPDATSTFTVSNKTYDLLRFFAVILLPGLGTMYFGVAQFWGLPKAEEVVGTLVAVDTFLGLIIRSLSKSYNKNDDRFDGVISVTPGEEPGTTAMNVGLSSEAIAKKSEVLVKVKKNL